MDIVLHPIGTIHTPHKNKSEAPIQPSRAEGAEGVVEVFPEYEEGLSDLEGFSHIYLLFYFHKSAGYSLKVTPYLENKLRGLFATRSPNRPCGIGLSVVRLLKIEGNKLYIKDADMLDGTPLLDIKPFTDEFDKRTEIKVGWLEGRLKRKSKRSSS